MHKGNQAPLAFATTSSLPTAPPDIRFTDSLASFAFGRKQIGELELKTFSSTTRLPLSLHAPGQKEKRSAGKALAERQWNPCQCEHRPRAEAVKRGEEACSALVWKGRRRG